ncbi:hypothetical protein BC938DRAFT_471219 [Jimgerdemannia flammicorona]|uniref:Alcohol dehydrogenase-like C-terminal domain-containing protein n=1 Tax=Jimgerdemannia flammicorona TaxID=994334 RepID=A0A433Q8N2_9FUNG|nr:hypothetical protein BC938DRAFT_471219 [Jimgerdemannia flammicorona]
MSCQRIERWCVRIFLETTTVITTVSSEEKAAISKANGAHCTVNDSTQDWAKEVAKITNNAGVNINEVKVNDQNSFFRLPGWLRCSWQIDFPRLVRRLRCPRRHRTLVSWSKVHILDLPSAFTYRPSTNNVPRKCSNG